MGMKDTISQHLHFPVVKLPEAVTRTPPGQILELALRYAPTFRGRASRWELLATVGIVFIISLVLSVVDPPQATSTTGPDQVDFTPFVIAKTVIFSLPMLSVFVRRLHDVNRHWYAIFVVLIPYIGWLILTGLLLWKGDQEENIFGMPPGQR